MTAKLNEHYIYLGTSETGTEYFLAKSDGAEVRSYLSGYVRRHTTTRSWHTGLITRTCWQINKVRKIKVPGHNYDWCVNERILLNTHDERYERMIDFAVNRTK